MEFKDLGLTPSLLKNIRNTGYEIPTPIQQATIPLVLEGKDVLGCAQTDTGGAYRVLSVEMPALEGVHEISLQFYGTFEDAAADWFRFSMHN